MPKTKKKEIEEVNVRPHRKFYVDDRLEFSLWFDESITDKDQILKDFFDSKDWKFMAEYCGWKVSKVDCSEDLLEIKIKLVKKKVDKE